MDTCNLDGITSSMADDIFFVLQKCTRSEVRYSCPHTQAEAAVECCVFVNS